MFLRSGLVGAAVDFDRTIVTDRRGSRAFAVMARAFLDLFNWPGVLMTGKRR
jgi:hypothetical protein